MSISQTIFRQYDVRGIVGTDMTAGVAYALGRGYAAYLGTQNIRGAVAVGRDNRPSGDLLRDELVRGLTDSGVDVVDVGVVPTPLLYWSLHHEPVVGGPVPRMRPGGRRVAVKGPSAAQELTDARAQALAAGLSDLAIVEVGSGVVDPPTTVITGVRRTAE